MSGIRRDVCFPRSCFFFVSICLIVCWISCHGLDRTFGDCQAIEIEVESSLTFYMEVISVIDNESN